jgi:preprotein translocase subunit YajC
MGTGILAAAAASTKPAGTDDSTLLIIVVVFVILMFFMFRSQRRRQQNAQNVQRAVVNGSRIRTVHGIYGTVVDGDDRNVIVEVAPGVNIKMLRQAVGQVVPDDEPDGVLHTDTDQSSDWSEDSSDDHGSDGYSSDDHSSDNHSSDNHSSADHSSEDQSSEEHSDLGR